MAGRGPGGGFTPISEEYPPGRIMVYVASDDIDGDLKRAERLGA